MFPLCDCVFRSLSGVVSSSTPAAGSKHARDETTEEGETEQPKRQRLGDGNFNSTQEPLHCTQNPL